MSIDAGFKSTREGNMSNISLTELKKINASQLKGSKLKKHITEMVTNSAQCKAILECMNQDTGEYRIVLEGIIEKE